VPTIALGVGFLKGFQTVFDLERNMISCESSFYTLLTDPQAGSTG
jgi:hypothetical protein